SAPRPQGSTIAAAHALVHGDRYQSRQDLPRTERLRNPRRSRPLAALPRSFRFRLRRHRRLNRALSLICAREGREWTGMIFTEENEGNEAAPTRAQAAAAPSAPTSTPRRPPTR